MPETGREGPGRLGAATELTDEQLLDVWAQTVGAVREGELRLHADVTSLRDDIRKRLGR